MRKIQTVSDILSATAVEVAEWADAQFLGRISALGDVSFKAPEDMEALAENVTDHRASPVA